MLDRRTFLGRSAAVAAGTLLGTSATPARLARARFVLLELHPDFIGAEACEGVRRRLSAAGLVRRGRVLNAEAWLRP